MMRRSGCEREVEGGGGGGRVEGGGGGEGRRGEGGRGDDGHLRRRRRRRVRGDGLRVRSRGRIGCCRVAAGCRLVLCLRSALRLSPLDVCDLLLVPCHPPPHLSRPHIQQQQLADVAADNANVGIERRQRDARHCDVEHGMHGGVALALLGPGATRGPPSATVALLRGRVRIVLPFVVLPTAASCCCCCCCCRRLLCCCSRCVVPSQQSALPVSGDDDAVCCGRGCDAGEGGEEAWRTARDDTAVSDVQHSDAAVLGAAQQMMAAGSGAAPAQALEPLRLRLMRCRGDAELCNEALLGQQQQHHAMLGREGQQRRVVQRRLRVGQRGGVGRVPEAAAEQQWAVVSRQSLQPEGARLCGALVC